MKRRGSATDAAVGAAAPGPVAAQLANESAWSRAVGQARTRPPSVKAGGKTVAQAKRAAVRSKAGGKTVARAKRAAVQGKAGGGTVVQAKRAAVRGEALARARFRTEGRASKHKLAAASVQRRLNLCREKAGEAAAACFARACRSYARNALICVNDEPARRRR